MTSLSPVWVGRAFLAAVMLAAPLAHAMDAGADDERAALKREISADHFKLMHLPVGGALSGDACSTACQALRSMRRATDRLCELEPGTSCEDARRRTGEAEARVTESCPSCVAATERGEASKKPSSVPKSAQTIDGTPAPEPPPQPPSPAPEPSKREEERSATGAAPAAKTESVSSPSRGGCAGCATTSESPSPKAFAALALIAGLALLRRRRSL